MIRRLTTAAALTASRPKTGHVSVPKDIKDKRMFCSPHFFIKLPRRWAAIGLAIGASLWLTGCASGPINGIEVSPPQKRSGASANDHAKCHLSITSIDDQRDQKDLGYISNKRVDGAQFIDWFRQGLTTLPGYTDAAAPVHLRVAILRAYIQASSFKSANLVVRVEVTTEGSTPQMKLYRGVDDSINWANSEGETQSAFNRALDNLKAQMHADLAQWCLQQER
jgi:hypothetical protein